MVLYKKEEREYFAKLLARDIIKGVENLNQSNKELKIVEGVISICFSNVNPEREIQCFGDLWDSDEVINFSLPGEDDDRVKIVSCNGGYASGNVLAMARAEKAYNAYEHDDWRDYTSDPDGTFDADWTSGSYAVVYPIFIENGREVGRIFVSLSEKGVGAIHLRKIVWDTYNTVAGQMVFCQMANPKPPQW